MNTQHKLDLNLVNQIEESIQIAQRILLHLHPSPDEDSVGGALAMMQALQNQGKQVTVISGDSPLPHKFHLMPGFDQIEVATYFDLNSNDFDLFIIQDSAAIDQVSKLGQIIFPSHLKTILIDHHVTNTGFANINLINASYKANCHLLIDLFKQSNWAITTDMAVCLFVGMYGDTGGFKYPGTDPELIAAASDMASLNDSFPEVIFAIENTKSVKSLRFEAEALNNIEVFCNNQVAIASISYDQFQKLDLTDSDINTGEIANKLKMVVDWQIAICCVERKPNLVKTSFRTRDEAKYHVGNIAQATGFGKGHPGAAGATFRMSLAEAKNLLIQTIKEIHPDLIGEAKT